MNPRDDERGLRVAAGGNKFAFAGMIRNRAHDLQHGASPQIYTESTKPVTIAIEEAARVQRTVIVREDAPPPRGSDFIVECRQCGASAMIRRKPGVEVRGRPPSRCAEHGLGQNWEQIA